MPLSGLLAEYGFDGGWPSIFYVFGLVGVIWSVAFLMFVYEDPSSHPRIDEKEKKYIISSLWGTANITVISFLYFIKLLFNAKFWYFISKTYSNSNILFFPFCISMVSFNRIPRGFCKQSPPVPYRAIMTSLPFYAILFAHMGQNYGYETLMTWLPTYMKQVLRFSIKEVCY